MILETNKSQYFNDFIYTDMKLYQLNFPTLEFTGYDFKALEEKLSHIYNAEQFAQVKQKVGKSIYFHHLFVESIVKRFSISRDGSSRQQTFDELLALVDAPAADSSNVSLPFPPSNL